MLPSLEILADNLLKKDIRPSYQRIKVLEYLAAHETHPTVDEIYHALSPEIPSLSKATIYNTLHTFAEAGLVRPICIDDAELRYDITISDHGHFKCDACGKIFNFEIDIDHIPVDGLNEFEINAKNVYFNGLCPSCLSQQPPKRS